MSAVTISQTRPADAGGAAGVRPRGLSGRDHAFAVVTGAAAGAAALAISAVPAARAVLGAELVPSFVLLAGGLGVLAYLDHVTHLIRNRHIAWLAALCAAALGVAEAAGHSDVLLPALAGGAAVFVFLLLAAMFTGSAGGGDVKLSPVPGAVLAAVSPLAAALWVCLSLFLPLGLLATRRVFTLLASGRRADTERGPMTTAMGPHMAVAALVAVPLAGWLIAPGTPLPGTW